MQALGDCLKHIQATTQTHIIFLTPVAKLFNQKDAKRLANKRHITLVCGRYEGFDERLIEKYADEVFSIGDFILTGGEIPALALCDSISRNIDGVVGNQQSLQGESFEKGTLESPNFTKPYFYEGIPAISAYSKGNHATIEKIRSGMAILRTKFYRPQLYQQLPKRDRHEK